MTELTTHVTEELGREQPDTETIAAVIPGIMGSCLESRHVDDSTTKGRKRRATVPSQVIWSESVAQIYRLLIDNPQALKFDQTPLPATRILKTLWVGPWRIARLYAGLDRFLAKHGAFQRPDSVLPLPYDWRDDLIRTAEGVSQSIGRHSGWDYAKANAPRRLVIVTHSMGALIARLAIIEGRIHPTNVLAMIHFAPPLLGSAKAFRATYGQNALPMLSALITWWRRWPNGTVALERLCDTLSSFPSIYQLMPPTNEPFIEVREGERRSPFDPRETAIRKPMKDRAEHVHAQLSRFADLAEASKLPVYTVAGVANWEDTEVSYRAFSGAERYWVLREFSPGLDFGDDTVSLRSATRGGREANVRQADGARHDLICNHRRAVEILGTILQSGLWNRTGTSS